MTEWRPIAGYEGIYEVSDDGRVRGLGAMGLRGRRKAGELKFNPVKDDYLTVWLCKDGKKRHPYVAHIVLETFVGPRPPGLVACHNDGNHRNNHVSNLRWDSYSANNHDIVRHGRNANSSKTHCKRGHEFTSKNTYVLKNGGRSCRTCLYYVHQRKWLAKNPRKQSR